MSVHATQVAAYFTRNVALQQIRAPVRGAPDPASPDHGHALAGRDLDLLEDAQRRPGRLGEDRQLVGQLFRHGVQVRDGQEEGLGEDPRPVDDAEHRATLAVAGAVGAASRALAADGVDLAHHAAADPLGRSGRLLHPAHELVARDAGVGVVALDQLEVGAADAGQQHPDARLAPRRGRCGDVVANPYPPVLQPDRAHAYCPSSPISFRAAFRTASNSSPVSRQCSVATLAVSMPRGTPQPSRQPAA